MPVSGGCQRSTLRYQTDIAAIHDPVAEPVSAFLRMSRVMPGGSRRGYRAGMKHVTFGDKSLFMGDDAADCLLEYSRLLADAARADTVTVRAIGSDGNTVDAAFLLNEASVLVIESTNSTVEPPGNDEAVQYMQERIDALQNPPEAQTEEPRGLSQYDDIDLSD
jgi:hypothetical protein